MAEIDLEVGQVVVRFIRRDWHNELGDQKRLLIPPPLDDNHMAIHSVRSKSDVQQGLKGSGCVFLAVLSHPHPFKDPTKTMARTKPALQRKIAF